MFHTHIGKVNDENKLSLLRVNGIGFSFYGKYREAFIGDYKTLV